MAFLRALCIMTAFIVLTLVCIPAQMMAVKLKLGWRKSFPRAYHRIVCRMIGLHVEQIGTPAEGGVLMAANHTGWIDIPVLSALGRVSFVAKSEINQWPFFGTLARLQRTIFIRRGERAKAREDRDNIRRRLMDGDALVIFPEGTSSDGNRVLPFKSALLSAAELPLGDVSEDPPRHAPVQPVSIALIRFHGMPMGRENRPFFAWYGDMELVPHLWEAFRLGPIDVVVEFHTPITIDQAGSRKQLAAAAEMAVRSGVIRALRGSAATAAPAPLADDGYDEELEDDEAA
jgi:1-acyl-sn-glycerol-3-phosphate acyltransferase